MRRGRLHRLLLAFGLAGCHASGSPPTGGSGPRVVSLHDVTTEVVVALGEGARLVGVEEPVDATTEVRAALARVPRVSSLETVVAREPDVVLGLDIVRRKDPVLVQTLEGAKKSVYLPELAALSDITAMIREVGKRIGANEAAERVAHRFEEAIGPVAAHSDHPARVFVYDCCDPPFTAGRRTVLSDMIAHAGGENIFADRDAAWIHVGWEEVLVRRPERIVVDAYRAGPEGELESKVAALRRMPNLASLPVTVMPLRNCLGGLGTTEGAALLHAAIGGKT